MILEKISILLILLPIFIEKLYKTYIEVLYIFARKIFVWQSRRDILYRFIRSYVSSGITKAPKQFVLGLFYALLINKVL
ncbi:hypothetical protein AD998_02095 [bacterium 336/3]|nr:hypothetical protein AD998_02095 [bacterium 336/3]